MHTNKTGMVHSETSVVMGAFSADGQPQRDRQKEDI